MSQSAEAKLQLKSRGTEDLFGCLRRLFHHRIPIVGPCPICSGQSRSAEICHVCIGRELQARGAKVGGVTELLEIMSQLQEWQRRADESQKYILETINRKQSEVPSGKSRCK